MYIWLCLRYSKILLAGKHLKWAHQPAHFFLSIIFPHRLLPWLPVHVAAVEAELDAVPDPVDDDEEALLETMEASSNQAKLKFTNHAMLSYTVHQCSDRQ